MLLYQPGPGEIQIATTRARTKFPSLSARLARAAAIVTEANLNLDADHEGWRVRSQSDRDTWHTTSSAGCSCDDYRHFAPHAAGKFYCKHLLAYYLYRWTLANELSRRLVGNMKYRNERVAGQLIPGSLLIDTDKTPRAVAYSPCHTFPRQVCLLRVDTLDRWVPRGDDDYLAISEWLADAPQFEHPQPLPHMEDYEATPERLPEWSMGDFRYWLDTGDTPAMRINF